MRNDRPAIRFEERGEITSIRVRKEFEGDDANIACDVTFKLACKADILSILTDAAEPLQAGLFDETDQPANRLKALRWDVELEDVDIRLQFARVGRKVEKALPVRRVKNFATEASSGRSVAMSFTVQCLNADDIVAYVHAWQAGYVTVELREPEQVDIEDVTQ